MTLQDPLPHEKMADKNEDPQRAPAFDGDSLQRRQLVSRSAELPGSAVTSTCETQDIVIIDEDSDMPRAAAGPYLGGVSPDVKLQAFSYGDEDIDSEDGRKLTWLALEKQAAESRCKDLERELAEARDAVSKRDVSLRVANEKIRHLEAESKGLLAAAEFREKEACDLEAGTREAQERAQAHQVALANALEQLSESGVSQSRKLLELAEVVQELQQTKASLERAERIVFQQRQEADQRQFEGNRRRLEMEALRGKLALVERRNKELLTKQAAAKMAKKSRGSFGSSSTFCAMLCGCFRGRPTYRRVTSTGGGAAAPSGSLNGNPVIPPDSPIDSPWLV